MRTIFFCFFLAVAAALYGETFNLGDGMTAIVTPNHYKLTWSQTSRNGGTVRGSMSGELKNGKRNGTWTANITYNKFLPDGAKSVRTGTISMARSYQNGVLHGSYTYDQKLDFREIIYTRDGWRYSTQVSPDNMSVKGAFDNGLFDGAWECRGDEKLLPSFSARFNKGVPEYIKEKEGGRIVETTFTDSIPTRYVTTSSNGSIEGWESRPGTDFNSIRRYKAEPSHGTGDDVNVSCSWCEYVVPRHIFDWLLLRPSGASRETADMIHYNRYNGEYDDMNFFGNEDYVSRMENLAHKQKQENQIKLLQDINDRYVAELQAARDSIRSSHTLTQEEEHFFRDTNINIHAPELKSAWQAYLQQRKDIFDFMSENEYNTYLRGEVKYKIHDISEEFNYDEERIRQAEFLLSVAEVEGAKWGVTDKSIIRNMALRCNPFSRRTKAEFIITSDRSEKSRDLKINSRNADNFIEWLMTQYKTSYTPKIDISEITDEDFFLWAVADNMKFDNYGNYKIIDGKVKKPEAVLDAVNTIRRNIPVGFDWGDITVERIAYGSVEQSGGVSYNMKMTRTVKVAEVYAKAKDSKDWLKLKESFAKIVEKSRKK